MFTENANRIFNRSIEEYHRWDDVDHPIDNPYAPGTIDHLLYHKNWIDTVQWHLEDIIRDPAIDPAEALLIKRRIDKSNQDGTWRTLSATRPSTPRRRFSSSAASTNRIRTVRTWWSTWTPTCWTNTRT